MVAQGASPASTGPWPARIRRGLEIAGAGALALLLLVFLYAPIQDPDVWWHLKAGWLILAEAAVPRANTFALYAAYPWIDHQWLYQVLLQGLWRLAGPEGLIVLKLLAGGGCWALLARTAAPPGGFLALLPFLAIGAVASNERMIDRPELLSCLFLVTSLALLMRWRRRPRARLLLALVALQVLWANVHGLAVLGCVAAGAFLAGESLPGRRPGPGSGIALRDLLGLALALFAGTAALAATPYGLTGALHALDLLGQLDNPAIGIAEFQGAFSDFRVTTAILAFRLLLALTAVVIVISLPRVDRSLLLLAVLMLILAASARRNIPFFVIAAILFAGAQLPVLGDRLGRMIPFSPARRALGRAISLALIAAMLLFARDAAGGKFYGRDGRIKRFGGGVDGAAILRETMDYVTQRDLPGPVFNDIDSGGYFIWRAYPGRAAFIDARLEALPPAQVEAYDRAIRSAGGWKALDGQAKFETVVIDHENPLHGPLIDRLAADPAWALVHLDAKGAVFTRRRETSPEIIAKEEIAPGLRAPLPLRPDERHPDRLADGIRALLAVGEEPDLRAPLAYAAVLLRLGFPDEAGDAAGMALLRAPRSPAALVMAGAAAEGSGEWDAAKRRYAKALEIDPANIEAHLNLGRLALREGALASALQRFDRAIAIDPRNAQARLLRGAAQARAGREAKQQKDKPPRDREGFLLKSVPPAGLNR
ncbi:MAG: tetratricopeptide repeat protein [Deltaproteobacteria bacterium]|nr:tetratricopeptide repeat protein [Deltaproteobacteria bacterium]